MNRRLIILSLLAVLAIVAALWLHLGSPAADGSPALTAAELDGLPATLDGDLRMMEELRRRYGGEPAAWRSMPDAVQAVYVTLWAEEVQRTATWSQHAATGMSETGEPSFDDIASSYEQLGCHETAPAIRALAASYGETTTAYQAWIEELRAGRKSPPPTTKRLDVAARTAFARLDAVRTQRLAFVRAHAAAWGVK